jgi:hypothetical protein
MSDVANAETPSGRALLGDLAYAHWPLRDAPATGWPAAGLIVLVTVATAAVSQSASAAGIVFAALAACGWSAILPTRYAFEAQGITRRTLIWRRTIAWAAIGHCEVWPRGVRLHRVADPGPLDAMRAVFIPFGNHREDVLLQIERRPRAAVSSAEKTGAARARRGQYRNERILTERRCSRRLAVVRVQ